jgi:hypothetical protein
LAPGKPALFLFATEDGTISGWSPSVDMTHATLTVNNSPGAVYKGLALLGNQFDPNTHKFTRLVSGGTASSPLNSPWGLVLALTARRSGGLLLEVISP